MTAIINGQPYECDEVVINHNNQCYLIQPLPEKIAVHKITKGNETAYLEISPIAPGIVTIK